MTPKRIILGILTIIVVLLVGRSLVGSWSEPQITSRLELYQTDLLLHASEFQSDSTNDIAPARNALLGEDPIATALEQYQTVRQSAQSDLEKFQAQLERVASAPATPEAKPTVVTITSPPDPSAQSQQLQSAIAQQQDLVNQLDLRSGILQAQQGKTEAALDTWTNIAERQASADVDSSETAIVLGGLWSDPPRLLPDAEQQIQQNLDGWFRYRSLSQLYQLQQRPDALTALQAAEQETAQQTLLKLALVGTAPLLGCLIGVGLLIFLIVQRFTQGQRSLLAQNETTPWETPWNWEIVWQVLIVGFFFVGQIVLPLLLGTVGISLAAFSNRARAAYALFFYLSMAGAGLFVLYLSIRPFLPLPEGWFSFKGRWFLWGLGGYLIALPLMIGVSLLNQQIWQGQGGSNPLLQIVLEEGDPVALAMFLFTAAIAAPLFEETLFRGFLLPSLTRYLPVWGAIAVSSLLFAIAHLSLSEVLPLTVLGSVLGFVYTRSRNLLAPMLLHGLWNSITMISLFILGSGVD